MAQLRLQCSNLNGHLYSMKIIDSPVWSCGSFSVVFWFVVLVPFLDITMNSKTGEHKPYMKPNDTPLYVHQESLSNTKLKFSLSLSLSLGLSRICSCWGFIQYHHN